MKKSLALFVFSLLTYITLAQPIKVMLVTGGHRFDTIQFFQLFDEISEIEYAHFEQPEANRAIAAGLADNFDVLIFYDLWNTITIDQQHAYMNLTKQGKPFLFLHHSLASYQNWPGFEKILGGRYVLENKKTPEEEWSNFESDIWVYCSVENYTPATVGFRQLRFFDEVYGNIRISENVKPLLRTRNPKSAEFVAWENKFNASTILYIQPGHDKRSFENDDFKKLISQSIQYLHTTGF